MFLCSGVTHPWASQHGAACWHSALPAFSAPLWWKNLEDKADFCQHQLIIWRQGLANFWGERPQWLPRLGGHSLLPPACAVLYKPPLQGLLPAPQPKLHWGRSQPRPAVAEILEITLGWIKKDLDKATQPLLYSEKPWLSLFCTDISRWGTHTVLDPVYNILTILSALLELLKTHQPPWGQTAVLAHGGLQYFNCTDSFRMCNSAAQSCTGAWTGFLTLSLLRH